MNFIRDDRGIEMGYSMERGSSIEYYVHGYGLIGMYEKRSKQYFAYGAGGSGYKSSSDIGTGEVYRVFKENV